MITTTKMTAHNDTELVTASLTGNREAFGHIVSRYQSLVCSLAYSATGNLTQSEDLAQETFVTAWKQLAGLREPAKLRSWLCGIARNVTNNWLRRQGREPSHAAESLEAIHESPSPEPLPHDQTISSEEAALLWRSLERIPETYREPLVLFYREHQSIEAVAQSLDLSEDAVKQRLTRGRKLLHEQVLVFVEGALSRTNPGKAFTIGVLAALPAFTISAKAATLGATAVQGSATAKAAATSGAIGAILGPVMGIFGTWVGYRMSLDDARTDAEKMYIRKFYRVLAMCIGGFMIVFTILMSFAPKIIAANKNLFIAVIIAMAASYAVAVIAVSVWSFRQRNKLLKLTADDTPTIHTKPAFEYRSATTLLGFPLVHIRVGGGLHAQRQIVKAWIAVGDCAFGLLFAFGGFTIAPLSIGGFAIGLLPFGGCAFGLLALGGFSVGVWSFGGLALGWQALGGCAIAWSAAFGGAAIAHDYALGGIATAAQFNNKIAAEAINALPFFHYGQIVLRHMVWLNLIWVLPMLYWWRLVVRQKKLRAAQA